MEVYNSFDGDMDLLLSQMFARLISSGDMGRMYSSPHTMHSFLHSCQPPNLVLFEHDDNGIWFFALYEPCFSGAFLSIWIREDKRHSIDAYESWMKVAWVGLKQFKVVMGVTKQEALIDQHLRFGYDLFGKIPKLFGGHDAWVLIVNEEKISGRIRKYCEKRRGSGLAEFIARASEQ